MYVADVLVEEAFVVGVVASAELIGAVVAFEDAIEILVADLILVEYERGFVRFA